VFNSYYNAVTAAGELAQAQLPALIELLDFPSTTHVTFDDILTSISAALSFTNPEEALLASFTRVAIGSSQVASYLFPPGSTASQLLQISDLSQSLGGVTQALLGNVNAALPLVLSNATNFITMAGNGSFSVAPSSTLFNDTQSLLLGLNTYLVSQAFQANNIVLTRAKNYDINAEIISDGGNTNYQTSCGNGYDALGICDAWWHDAAANVTYGLMNWNSAGNNYHSEMEAIFTNWTTPELLFTAAAGCYDSGSDAQNNPLDLLSVTPTGVNS
jgi:hypothetical protein